LFSATMPDSVRETSRQFQRDPLDVTVASEADEPAIEEVFIKVDTEEKIDALEAVLLHYRPESAVIFCNTRQDVRVVTGELDAKDFAVLALHGELDQREREEMLVRFANRSCTVLVASDVAARGLDIAELAMVINYDIATDADTHLHRIGRTGRAGRQGIAVSLCAPREASRVKVIEARSGKPVAWRELPKRSSASGPLVAPFATLAIDAGRKDKLRPGDLLGALTGSAGLPGEAIGKIDVFPTRTYVAVKRGLDDQALQRLRSGQIKGRTFRVRRV
jgi:ATP-dependent RNA helicase DbpA